LAGRPGGDGALLATAAALEAAGVVGAITPPRRVETKETT
jgi:hypothetical protein